MAWPIQRSWTFSANTSWIRIHTQHQLGASGSITANCQWWFLGGSINAQWGKTAYLITGWGRTNLRSYYNLNFDPNDATTIGLGGWLSPAHQWSVWRTQDDRLQTGQRVTHVMWRYHLPNSQRLTVDAATKTGRSDLSSDVVKGNSLSVTWDWPTYFVRFAHDQKVNFSGEDQKRISLGWRF